MLLTKQFHQLVTDTVECPACGAPPKTPCNNPTEFLQTNTMTYAARILLYREILCMLVTRRDPPN